MKNLTSTSWPDEKWFYRSDNVWLVDFSFGFVANGQTLPDLGNYLPSTAMIAVVSMNLKVVGTEFVLKRTNNWLENLSSNVFYSNYVGKEENGKVWNECSAYKSRWHWLAK